MKIIASDYVTINIHSELDKIPFPYRIDWIALKNKGKLDLKWETKTLSPVPGNSLDLHSKVIPNLIKYLNQNDLIIREFGINAASEWVRDMVYIWDNLEPGDGVMVNNQFMEKRETSKDIAPHLWLIALGLPKKGLVIN